MRPSCAPCPGSSCGGAQGAVRVLQHPLRAGREMGQEMGQGSATAVGCQGIRRRHSRGLAGLGAGKEAEDSHTRGCAHPHVPWGLQPASLICSNHTEAICIGDRFIFSFYTQHFINSLPKLPDCTAKCLWPSRLHRAGGEAAGRSQSPGKARRILSDAQAPRRARTPTLSYGRGKPLEPSRGSLEKPRTWPVGEAG